VRTTRIRLLHATTTTTTVSKTHGKQCYRTGNNTDGYECQKQHAMIADTTTGILHTNLICSTTDESTCRSGAIPSRQCCCSRRRGRPGCSFGRTRASAAGAWSVDESDPQSFFFKVFLGGRGGCVGCEGERAFWVCVCVCVCDTHSLTHTPKQAAAPQKRARGGSKTGPRGLAWFRLRPFEQLSVANY